MDGHGEGAEEREPRRPWPASLAVGLVAAVLGAGSAVTVVAMPLFALAQLSEPEKGVNRPLVHQGLTKVVFPVALVVAVLALVLATWWWRRGGRLPDVEGEA